MNKGTEKINHLENLLNNYKEEQDDLKKINSLTEKLIDLGICPVCGSKLQDKIIKERVFIFFTNQRKFTFCSKDKAHYNEEDVNGGLGEESQDE